MVLLKKNRTLIEQLEQASILSFTYSILGDIAEAVNTACYVANRVGGNVSSMMMFEDLDDQHLLFHVQSFHTAQKTYSKETYSSADKEVPLSSEDQALHDELVNSDDDVPKAGVFSTNSFDNEHTDNEEDRAPDYNNMDHTIDVSSTPTLRIHKIHPQKIIGKSTAGVQTRRKLKESASVQHQALLSFIYKQNRTIHKDQQTCLFACFLSQEEPKKVSQALSDENSKRVIGTKWVFRNKRDERGTIIKNKARLVAQGYRQEEGVDYDEVFAPVARIEAIRLFLAFASFMGFTVYQMDCQNAFLYVNITRSVYVNKPPGFEDPAHPNKVYRVVKALYGLHQAPPKRAWIERDIIVGTGFQVTPKSPRHASIKGSLGGCQYLGRRPVSWECKKQTIMAISSTKAEYVAAASLLCSWILLTKEALNQWQDYFLVVTIYDEPKVNGLRRTNIKVLKHSSDVVQLERIFGSSNMLPSLRIINDVPHIRAMVVGKRVLISEETIRADLLFDDADGVDCFPKQVIWDSLRDIGYEGHIANGKPFLMYPRFIQLFLNKQLEGVTRPQNFLPSVTLPSKVFTFMRKHSPKFSCRITPLTPPYVRGTPTQSADLQGASHTQGTAESQGTAETQGPAEAQGAADIPKSPNDYTPTDASQTSGGDEGLLDLYALNREKRGKKKKKKVSSVKLGRNKDKGNLSEEHHDQDDHTTFVYEGFDATEAAVTPDFKKKSDEQKD
ncbi:putative ribonuclease H-like domain-containing protein [Tanacetum coccineum]